MAKSLAVIKSKKDNIFSQIQEIFDLTKKTSDKSILQKLLVCAKSINRLREEFSDILDIYHELEIQANPNFQPNYAPLNSINELVDYINSTVYSIESKMSSTRPKCEIVTPQLHIRLPKL